MRFLRDDCRDADALHKLLIGYGKPVRYAAAGGPNQVVSASASPS